MSDPRDRLWDSVWLQAYDAAYAKESAAFMLRRWLKIDLICRTVVAVSTPTSAIAGWTWWQDERGRSVWAVIAGLASLFAIFEGIVASQERVRRYSELGSMFTRLHQDLAHLLDDMKLRPDFDLGVVQSKYEDARRRYSELLITFPADVFFTRRAENIVQTNLDSSLTSHGN